MTVSGDQWPIFLYSGYNFDPEDPWDGLFRSSILVSVSWYLFAETLRTNPAYSQAYKYIFTSPSSVEKEPKATRSGNARIHGMTSVTLPSIAYVATQVSSSIVLFLWLTTPRPGTVRIELIAGVFEDGLENRFWTLLQFCPGFIRWCWWVGRDRQASYLVESVISSNLSMKPDLIVNTGRYFLATLQHSVPSTRIAPWRRLERGAPLWNRERLMLRAVFSGLTSYIFDVGWTINFIILSVR
jgi:hypothetical protein